MTLIASTLAPRSCASFTAVAIISSPISPSFIGTRIFENAACGGSSRSALASTCSSSPVPLRAADEQ